MLAKSSPVIMDWMTAGSGDPAADVARTMLLLSLSELPDSIPGFVKIVFSIARRVMKNTYFRVYRRLSRMETADITAWYIPLAPLG